MMPTKSNVERFRDGLERLSGRLDRESLLWSVDSKLDRAERIADAVKRERPDDLLIGVTYDLIGAVRALAALEEKRS